MNEPFKLLIDKLVKRQLPITIISGTVTAIRDNEIDVSPGEDLPELLSVRFHAVLTEVENRFKIIPKLGSQVLCGIIENDPGEALLLCCSEIEKVEIHIEELQFELQREGVRISNKGENLKSVINDLQDEIGKLCSEVAKIVVSVGVSPDVPAINLIKKTIVETNKNSINKILIE